MTTLRGEGFSGPKTGHHRAIHLNLRDEPTDRPLVYRQSDFLCSDHVFNHPDKTRRIEFGRLAEQNRERRGEGKPETFDFLGFSVLQKHTDKEFIMN